MNAPANVGRLRDVPRRADGDPDAAALALRIEALDRFTAASACLPSRLLAPATAVSRHAGRRLELSGDHTVVALAGATGSGKSSLFNALVGMELSPAGVRRPITGVAHACVWREASAASLLDWLGIPRAKRFVRESPLDADDQAAFRGLVLLDLPDFDSIEAEHRAEVDRLLLRVDLVVWVTDPQKYADQVIHEQYLQVFRRHAQSMVVVLNQADRLTDTDVERCLSHLRSLLTTDGLGTVPMFATSATGGRPGASELRALLERAVADRLAALRRLDADVDDAVATLAPLVGPPAPDRLDHAAVRELRDALATSAGAPAVSEAAARAYAFRARKSVGWPLTRWIRAARMDPLARMRLGRATATGLSPTSPSATSPSGANASETSPTDPGFKATNATEPSATERSITMQRSTAALAVREIAERAGTGLPEPWADAVADAARSSRRDLPDALDHAVVGTDLGVDRRPLWWRAAGVLQWLVMLAALAGAVWLLARVGLVELGLPTYDVVRVGPVPLAVFLLAGGIVAGILLAVLGRPLIALGARRARKRAARRLHAAISDVSRRHVEAPTDAVLGQYTQARSALAEAAR